MTNQLLDSYNDKLKRLDKCVKFEKVDRVPIAVATLYFSAKYSNLSYDTMFYDTEKYKEAAAKFALDFNWDAACFLRSFETVTLGLSLAASDPKLAINVAIASVMGGGFAHDILKDIYASHPGRELPKDGESHFLIKDTVISPEEYDEFIVNPLQFLSDIVVPRVYRSLNKPGSSESNAALINLGLQLGPSLNNVVEFTKRMKEVNCPPWYMALAPNPLDFIGSFVRNFDKVLFDIRRYPTKIKKLCEELAPVFAAVGKATGQLSYDLTGSKRVFLPVWYNSFLSNKQFKEFHWPYIKYIAEELIKEGFTPLLSFQGEHDHLLDTILELPEGKAIAWFDRTDVIKAKKVIGEHTCVAGGISPSLLIGGTPEEVDSRIKLILDEIKPAKGFIFTLPFNAIGPAKIENVKAMTEAVFKYGEY
ncbi:uroporphyrinogen decarboxylase [Oxobacter pfennigii]|uniref:Uroporphyrinogen decarboxylase n=1 Tax=Oxobacter pfennigii TaxID=36849 RepID=A0A0P8YZL4_9CLOT|nr:uroporphyrinogen decarboxylase family protein [Oxobacter pfennigii]KPU45322.1 uroporphyrinogen decarboxylase [Oxobacter pfennigii]